MITFLWVGFPVLIKSVLFWKRQNIGAVSHPEVISWSLQLHFVKYHKKEPLSQTLVCCYIMALLFLETLIYCSIRKKVSVFNNFFYPALFWLVENIFGLTLLLILYMDVNSHVKSVIKVGCREQINYMKFINVCVLVIQKQWSIKSDFAIKFIKCQTISTRTYILGLIKSTP